MDNVEMVVFIRNTKCLNLCKNAANTNFGTNFRQFLVLSFINCGPRSTSSLCFLGHELDKATIPVADVVVRIKFDTNLSRSVMLLANVKALLFLPLELLLL